MMKHSIELGADLGVNLRGLLTWAFTFPGTPYFSGYRALATNGIELPVLAAFQLLGRLDGTRLPLTSSGAHPLAEILANSLRGEPEIDGMATLNGATVQVLVWNYHDDIATVPAAPVHLTIQVPSSFGSRARVSHLRVDEAHGDAYTTWVSQGMPQSPATTQIAALQRAMSPSLLSPDRNLQVANGAVEIDFDLPRFGVSLLTISPTSDDGSDGASSAPGGSSDCACHIAAANGSSDLAAFLQLSALLQLTLVGRWRRARRRQEQ
jgi:xylan 1,4-beta-xylosidase